MDDTPAQEPVKHGWIFPTALVVGAALGFILSRILMELFRVWTVGNGYGVGPSASIMPGGLFVGGVLGAGCPLVCIIMVRRFLTRLVTRSE